MSRTLACITIILSALAAAVAHAQIAPGLDDGTIRLGTKTAFDLRGQPNEEAQFEMNCANTLRSTRQNPNFRGAPSLPYCAALETAIGLIALHNHWPGADHIAANARMLVAADLQALGSPTYSANSTYAALEGEVRGKLRQFDAVASAPTEHYTNKFGNSHIAITHLLDGTLHATLDTGGGGCGGQVSGPLVASGVVLHMSRADDSTNADDGCDLDITVKGSHAEVHEAKCSAWHGASCEFSGAYRRVR
jgi:hypothetical protein